MKNRLFIQLSLIFLVVIIILASIIGYMSFNMAHSYHEDASQKLGAKIAQFTSNETAPFLENGDIDTTAIQDIMHSMMVINPDVEVYMLDNIGNIKFHVAPYKVVVRERISLAPIKKFLAMGDDISCVKGDDPRDFEQKKIFSAAPIMENDIQKGYYYIILASQDKATALAGLKSLYAMKLGGWLLGLAILVSLLLGLGAIWYQTRSLSTIMNTMNLFKSGDFTSRIKIGKDKNFETLASTFNSMAGKIETQFNTIKEVDNFRKELIANVSHDLRTPLAVIKGYSETLNIKGSSLTESDKEKYLHNIHDSTTRLEGLINQLFELSKLESNQIELVKEPFSLDELASDMLSSYEVLANKKNISLSLKRMNSTGLCYGDISLVERVIQNLLDNALKFTPEGGEIKLAIEKESDIVKFEISDTGVGIAEEDLSAIFERYKSSTVNKKKGKGLGLGLAIAKKIIEMHDSSINVSSQVNAGTSFSFGLPLYAVG